MNQASDLSESKSTAPPLVYLLQAETGIEKRILEQWIKANAPEGAEFITIAFPRQQSSIVPPELGPRLARRDDPLLSPVRVAWLPKLRQGRRDITLSDLLLTGDPRQPRTYAKHLIAKHQPQRYRVLTGEPATLSSLREIWNRQAGESMDPDSFSAFIVRRATLSLEREESQLLGPQYKMPRLVKEDIKASARFREGLAREAERAGVPMARAEELAEAALSELASGYTPLGVDINRSMGRLFYKQAYDDQIDYDLDQVEQLRDVFKHNPGVVLPSHRTNLDAGVMANAFHELQLPKTSTLGGINMAFFPMGFFFRRSGIIFIRRNTGKDAKRDPLYRWILKEYLGYILEKGFSLEWYIEGTRSRTGKSMPAKLGLLKYAVEAYRDGRIRDLSLIPASMSYDYLNDVHDYAAEAVGATKSPEDFRWYLRWFRSLRGQAYGKIYVRFGTPVSVAAALGTPEQARALDAKEFSLALHKLAFEVSWRINQVTPMTSTSLIAMTLLSAFNQALSLPQLCMLLRSFVEYADARALPLTDNARELLTEDGVRDQLALMVQRNLVHAETDGPESVYAIGPNQHIVASFFRNSIIHHFLVPAISELALMAASKAEPGKMLDTFWDTAFQLRDTLKFDFFFLEKTQFRESVIEHMFLTSSDWSAQLENEQNDLTEIISTIDPLTAESVLRSFIESYWVVGHCLQLRPDLAQTSKKDFIRFCAGTARQYLMQRRLRNPETGSMLLYQAGLELAINRGLVANADGIEQKRDVFTAEMRHLLDLIDEIHLIGRRAFNQRLQQGNL